MGDVRTRVDSTWIITLAGHLSGTGATAMTGTLDKGTNLAAVVSYPAAGYANPALPGFVYPSGAFQIEMPLGAISPPIKDVLTVTDYWNVNMSSLSGSDAHSSNLATIQNYRVVPLGHNSPSGTYAAAFQTALTDSTGTVQWVYGIPQDLQNPGNMAVEWQFMAIGRKTARKQ